MALILTSIRLHRLMNKHGKGNITPLHKPVENCRRTRLSTLTDGIQRLFISPWSGKASQDEGAVQVQSPSPTLQKGLNVSSINSKAGLEGLTIAIPYIQLQPPEPRYEGGLEWREDGQTHWLHPSGSLITEDYSSMQSRCTVKDQDQKGRGCIPLDARHVRF